MTLPVARKRILMCPPTYFKILKGIEPKGNKLMARSQQPDKNLALQQWTAVRDLYTAQSFTVPELCPKPNLFDMTFTANGAWGLWNPLIKKYEFILSNLALNHRKPEAELHGRFLKQELDCNVMRLPVNIVFEGQGDALTTSVAHLMGWGPRTHREAAAYLKIMLELGKPLVTLHIVDDMLYHLDTCAMSLDQHNTLLYHPDAFDQESKTALKNSGLALYEIPRSIAVLLACNSASTGNVFFLNAPFHPPQELFELSAQGVAINECDPRFSWLLNKERDYLELLEFLWSLNYKIVPVFTSEFYKSGGGVRCLTFFID